MKTDAVLKAKPAPSVHYDVHNLFNSRPLGNFSFAVTFFASSQTALSCARVSRLISAPSGILTTSGLRSVSPGKTYLFAPRGTCALPRQRNHLIFQPLGNFSFAVSNSRAESFLSSGSTGSSIALHRSRNLPVDTLTTFHQSIRIR
jgi:hypothetical protein